MLNTQNNEAILDSNLAESSCFHCGLVILSFAIRHLILSILITFIILNGFMLIVFGTIYIRFPA
jgi:hypothetical protein